MSFGATIHPGMEGDDSRTAPLPLQGIRVLDLGMVWAGPQATALLADLGADVVKVEGPTHPDPFRSMFGAADPALFPEDELLEWSPLFCSLNRNKRGILLDLRSPEGAETCRRLAVVADVVLDNFSARVLPRLGLGYDVLRRDNPHLVTCSMAGFGRTGPWRDVVTYGPMVEQLSGALALSGYPDTGPVGLASAFDAIAGCHGALAIVAALVGRLRSGHAADLDMAQMETGPRVTAPFIADRQLGHPPYLRDGNADPDAAPRRMYRCAGKDAWVAVSARDDASASALLRLVAGPSLAGDPRFATAALRKSHEAELDALIAAWCRVRTCDEAAAALQAAGVTAAPLRSVAEAVDDPRVRRADAFVSVDRIPNGRREYPAPPLRIDGRRLPVHRPAPRLGEHTTEVLEEWGNAEPRVADWIPPSWLPPLSAGEPPLRGIRVLARGASDAVAVAARELCDLGAAVWRDPVALGAAEKRTPGARLYFGAGMRSSPVPDEHDVVVTDLSLGDPPPARIVVTVEDVVDGWRIDDLTACALSSLSWRIGDPGREPLEPGRGYPSAVAGVLAALAAVALLFDEARREGRAVEGLAGRGTPARGASGVGIGQDRHLLRPRTAIVSLIESALLVGTFDTTVLSFGGTPPPRSRRPWPNLAFACRDGWVGIFPRTDEMWEALCVMTERVDLLADPRLATFTGRQQHTEEIREALAPWFAARTKNEAETAARELRVPLAPVCDPGDTLDVVQFRARGLFVPVVAPDGREVLVPGVPYLSDGVRFGAGRVAAAAALGADG